MKTSDISQFSLVPLDTEGEWNRPLLENAAALSDAPCVFASSGTAATELQNGTCLLDEVLDGFQHIVACEAVRDSRSVYAFPAPRGSTAVIVGNEEKGVPRSVLKRADAIVVVPMTGAGMSSVNVAVSAAVVLYAFSKDLGRRKKPPSRLRRRDIDVLIDAPPDPHELGSLLRSAWAFGWRRMFVADEHRVWFGAEQKVILEGRAAARRAKNPIAVLPADRLDAADYDGIAVCDGRREGTPLSRWRLPACERLLVVVGSGAHGARPAAERVYVDHVNAVVEPRFRHSGSILLSMISEFSAA